MTDPYHHIASAHPRQIIDYGKFKYSQEKKKKEQKKKAKTTEVKEVKMSYKIENHDYGVRMKQVRFACLLFFFVWGVCRATSEVSLFDVWLAD